MLDDDECPNLISAKVPVTILTGFLGSGKTTLLHYVLTAEHQLRIAVIVNEFEFGKTIEKGLTLKSSEKDDDEWVELKNGCMCCSAQSQTIAALENLIQTKGTFDLILVETAGLADPGPVAGLFWQDEAVCGNLFLSGIITVVDAVNIFRYLSDAEVTREATRQIAIADKILLNKCDLVEEKDRFSVRSAIEKLNPSAEIMETQFSKVSNLREVLFMDTTRSLPSTLTDHLHSNNGVHSSLEIHPAYPQEGALPPGSKKISAIPLEFFSSETTLAAHTVKGIEEIAKEILYPESLQMADNAGLKYDGQLDGSDKYSVKRVEAHQGYHHIKRTKVKKTLRTSSFPSLSVSATQQLPSTEEIEKITESPSTGDGFADEPCFEVIRCKAAIWVYQPSSPSAPVNPGTSPSIPNSSACNSFSGATRDGLSKDYQLYQLQCIGELFDIKPMEGESVPFGCSRALILGRNLSEENLRRIFLKHLVPTP